MAAFLSSAMEEGIRIDSCDDFNTDAIYGTNYPLSNACGQYGRSWDLEECSGMEPFHCALDKTMETAAVDTGESSIPPFTCRARTMNGDFPGFYDAINNLVDESEFVICIHGLIIICSLPQYHDLILRIISLSIDQPHTQIL